MKHSRKIALLAAFALAALPNAFAVDVTGKWTSEFESQVGHLKYIFQLKGDGDKFTGTSHRESAQSKHDQEINDGKIDGDKISFSETLHIQDQDFKIEYQGTIDGDEMKLTRKVGDFGSIDIVAKRASVEAPSATGKWRAEFDTQIGKQKYLFTLKADGTNVTGKANAEIGDQKIETPLSDGKINAADISFVENMDFSGQPIRIEYKGALDGDQIKFTRKVGDIATEEFTASREK
jgi:hypothetical protein